MNLVPYMRLKDDRTGQLVSVVKVPAGHMVIDLDFKNGKDASRTLSALSLALPDTFHYSSKSGYGWHYWYRSPEDVATDTDNPRRDGVDILGPGFNVMIPEPGANDLLTNLSAAPLAAAPSWVYNKRTATRRPGARGRGAAIVPQDGEPVVRGDRHRYLVQRACLLLSMKFDDSDVLRLVQKANAEKCAPPKSDADVEKMVTNVVKLYGDELRRG